MFLSKWKKCITLFYISLLPCVAHADIEWGSQKDGTVNANLSVQVPDGEGMNFATAIKFDGLASNQGRCTVNGIYSSGGVSESAQLGTYYAGESANFENAPYVPRSVAAKYAEGNPLNISLRINCHNKSFTAINSPVRLAYGQADGPSTCRGYCITPGYTKYKSIGYIDIPPTIVCTASLPSSTLDAGRFDAKNLTQFGNAFTIKYNAGTSNLGGPIAYISLTSPEMTEVEGWPAFPIKDSSGNPLLSMTIQNGIGACDSSVQKPAICFSLLPERSVELRFVARQIKKAGQGTGFLTAHILCR